MADALFGKTWQLNPARTIFSTSLAPAHETRLYEELPGGYRLTVEGTHNGAPYRWGYTALYDGLPHPVYGRSDVDTITAYRVNDKITIGFFSKNGLEGGSYSRRLSEDGHSLTVEAAGRNASGLPYFDVTNYSAS